MNQPSPFKYFKTSPEIIRLAVMLYALPTKASVRGQYKPDPPDECVHHLGGTKKRGKPEKSARLQHASQGTCG